MIMDEEGLDAIYMSVTDRGLGQLEAGAAAPAAHAAAQTPEEAEEAGTEAGR